LTKYISLSNNFNSFNFLDSVSDLRMATKEEAVAVNGHPGEEGGAGRAAAKAEPNCCLLENGKRCPRPASNASYSKRIQGTVAQRKLRLGMDPGSPHIYICDYHKSVIQTVRTKRKRRESEDSVEEPVVAAPAVKQEQSDMVDLFQLQMNTLRRYKNHFKVTSRPGLNKAQLADSLSRHFHSLPVTEKEAITYFLYMVKTGASRLEQPGGKQQFT